MTPSSLWLFVGIPLGLYVVGMALLAYGRLRSARNVSADAPPACISVVVPARNEAFTIGACLDALHEQVLPGDTQLQIIVVDDHSTDATLSRARQRLRSAAVAGTETWEQDSPHEALRLPLRYGRGKETAVSYGIEQAIGEVVLVVDADCAPPPKWATTLATACSSDTPVVCGPVRYDIDDERWFERFQALEFLGLNAYGAGTAGLGVPTICNGGNMGLHRSLIDTIERAQLSSHLAADELLLQHVAYRTPNNARYLWHASATVTTRPASSWRAFWNQRKRWAHATRSYHPVPWLLSASTFVVHAVLLVAFAIALSDPDALSQPVMTGLLAKMGADLLLVLPASHAVDHRDLMRSYIPAALLQVAYLVGAGLHGMFGAVRWKGRTVDT